MVRYENTDQAKVPGWGNEKLNIREGPLQFFQVLNCSILLIT